MTLPPIFSNSIFFSQLSSNCAALVMALAIPYLSGSGSAPKAIRIFSFCFSVNL